MVAYGRAHVAVLQALDPPGNLVAERLARRQLLQQLLRRKAAPRLADVAEGHGGHVAVGKAERKHLRVLVHQLGQRVAARGAAVRLLHPAPDLTVSKAVCKAGGH